MAEVKDFLNPNSMLTPGIAGGITMMIANALWVNFGLAPKYTALVLCALLGLVVLAELKVPLWQKPVYYIINVLVIFSVSAGTNVVGMSADTTNLANQTTEVVEEKVAVSFNLSDISNFFINSAMADDTLTKRIVSTAKKPVQAKKKSSLVSNATNQVTKPRKKAAVISKKQNRKFFQSWF